MFIYYCALALTNIIRGAYIVTLGWIALDISNDIATVGLVFVISHILNILLGPVIGVYIDRLNKRVLVAFGQTINFIALSIPEILKFLSHELTLGTIVILAIIVSLGTLIMAGAMDALQQTLANKTGGYQARISAISGGIRQGAMVAGAGASGLSVHYFSPTMAFFVIAICCLITAILMLKLPNSTTHLRVPTSVIADLKSGFVEFRKYPELWRLGILTAIGFSVGQMSNALLPGLVRYEVGGDSRLYSVVDALWSVGGILFSFAIAHRLQKTHLKNIEYIAGVLLGGLLLAASMANNQYYLMIVYFCLGGAFSVLKVLSDGRALTICSEDVIGRVRTHFQSMTSIVGVFIYVSPSIININSPKTIYIIWGFVVFSLSIYLLLQNLSVQLTNHDNI